MNTDRAALTANNSPLMGLGVPSEARPTAQLAPLVAAARSAETNVVAAIGPTRRCAIALENVSKTFSTPEGDFRAVTAASLEIEEGEVYGIIGFSGAGKSTLLRTINLLERPDAGGKIIVNGQNLTTLSKSELNTARQSIGMIFQHFNLLNNLTVAGNVAFPLEIAGKSKAERTQRVRECLDIVGLTEKATSYPAKLSGGQKQRVAIARALANEPKILLCDEPTSAVDPQTTGTILAFLRQINERFGITIVIVTHEMEVVKGICNKVAVMEHGKIVEKFAIGDKSYLAQSEIAKFLLRDRLSAPTFLGDYVPSI